MERHPYILTPDELRKLQMVLLEMLLELDRICRKNNIRYVLDAGTMLGAVRHKAFIPWDDDIDIVMMREEYDRFREACVNDLNPQKFFYQDHTTDPHYRWGYARIRRIGSEFVRVGQEHMKMKTGIFLDIFPRDNVPDSKALRIWHNFYCFLLRKIQYAEIGKLSAKRISQRAAYRLIGMISIAFVFRRLDKLAAIWNRKPTTLVRTLTFPILSSARYGYKREWFEDTIVVEFEGHVFPGMRHYDEFLTCLYGDYMSLPPENKRHWHPVSAFKLPDV